MSDAALRELERAVAQGGGAAARLRLARELERLGRVDEAVAALVPARDELEVRRVLARLRPLGTSDVRPVRTEPRLLWERPIEIVSWMHTDLFATPAAVWITGGGDRGRAYDARTGETLWSFPGSDRLLPIAGTLVHLISRHEMVIVDVASGEASPLLRLDGEILVRDGVDLVFATHGPREKRSLRGYRLEGDPPRPVEDFAWPIVEPTASTDFGVAMVTPTVVILQSVAPGSSYYALDRQTGELRWRVRASDVCANRAVPVVFSNETEAFAVGEDGCRTWSIEGSWYIPRETPDFLVLAPTGRREGLIVRRRDGWRAGLFERSLFDACIVRDVVYLPCQSERLANVHAVDALSLDGARLWQFPLPGSVHELGFTDGIVVTLDEAGMLRVHGEPTI